MRRKALAEANIKTEGDDLEPFEFWAYASVFGNQDSHGDVVEPGAFTESLTAWAAKGDRIPLVWAHGSDPASYLGYVVDAVEDEHGLRVKARIDPETPHGKTVHRMVADRAVNQLSFAYTVRDSERRGDHVALKQLDLHEVTLCYRGANDQTEVLAVKSKQDNNIQPKGDTMKIKDQLEAVKTKAREIVDGAKAEGVELTPEQASEVAGLLDQVQTFEGQIAERQKSADLIAAVEALGGSAATPAENGGEKTGAQIAGRKYLALSGTKARATAGTLSKAMLGGVGTKSLVAAGSSVVGVPLEDQSPIELQRIPTSLLDVLPVTTHSSPTYRYLRQKARTNSAAPWVTGDKPVSQYQIESVDAALTVVAHISDGLSTYDLLDNATLSEFIESEMLHGLRKAVEAQVLNGSGTAPNMRGILNTSGIVGQAFVTDPITTTRKAITLLEASGYVPAVFVLRPEAWEAISLQRAGGSGTFDLGNVAVDRAAQRLHGVPVVVSTALPAKKGLLLDASAVRVDADTQGVQVAWGTVGDDFSQNLVRVRTEGRFGVSVLRAGGVVEVATAA